MLHSLAERIAFFLFDETDEYPLEIYTYGMELILSSIAETFILIVLGVVFSRFLETLIFIISFSSIRFFTGGYHAKSYVRCAVVTLIIYFICLISHEMINLFTFATVLIISGVIFFGSLIVIGLFTPIENKNKKIENKQRLKRISLITLVLEFVLFFTGLFADFSQALVILPTVLSVGVLMLVEIIRKRGDKVE